MPTPEELLEKLEERLILGEISEEIYKQLKAKLLAKVQPGGGKAGGMSVSDSVVKGDLTNTSGAASVGNIIVNLPPAMQPVPFPPPGGYPQTGGLLACPLCGRRNEMKDTFRCRRCDRDNLCLEHFVKEARMCDDCAAKDAASLAETRRRQDEAERARREEAERLRRQEEEARKAAEPARELELDCGRGVKMKQVLIPAGSFMMGSPDSDPDASNEEKPHHKVTITKPFYMGIYPVTQDQYQAVMGSNPSNFKGGANPVEQVNWHDAVAFCEKLSAKTGINIYLPTEAQWEYACRAGSTGIFSGTGRVDQMGWYGGNSGGKTHPVGQKRPNAWGLYDMHGNVWEWCADWYGEDYYANASDDDPQGPSSGTNRVLRGGSWSSYPRSCRSADRAGFDPSIRYDGIGFRVVLD